jgi:hypothetical protein
MGEPIRIDYQGEKSRNKQYDGSNGAVSSCANPDLSAAQCRTRKGLLPRLVPSQVAGTAPQWRTTASRFAERPPNGDTEWETHGGGCLEMRTYVIRYIVTIAVNLKRDNKVVSLNLCCDRL